MYEYQWDKIPKKLTLPESKKIALEVLHYSKKLALELFSDGDLSGYLDLLSRVPSYCYYNLLLLYKQYPDASYLAGYTVWDEIVKSQGGSQILKDQWKGRPIYLIAPIKDTMYLSGSSSSYERFVWYTAKLFDISQTHCRKQPVQFIYDYQKEDHIDYLMDSISAVISTYHNYRVILAKPLVSTIRNKERALYVPPDWSDEKKIHWLTENILLFSVSDVSFSPDTYRLLIDSMIYCLFKIWKLDTSRIPAIPKGCYTMVQRTEQEPFLDLLQKTVFEVNQQVSRAYLGFRKEDNEDLAFSDDELYMFLHHN